MEPDFCANGSFAWIHLWLSQNWVSFITYMRLITISHFHRGHIIKSPPDLICCCSPSVLRLCSCLWLECFVFVRVWSTDCSYTCHLECKSKVQIDCNKRDREPKEAPSPRRHSSSTASQCRVSILKDMTGNGCHFWGGVQRKSKHFDVCSRGVHESGLGNGRVLSFRAHTFT